MPLVIMVCVGVAFYCFMNGMPGAGIIALFGMSSTYGFIALIMTSAVLVLNEHYIAAFFPVFIIVFNIWGLLVPKIDLNNSLNGNQARGFTDIVSEPDHDDNSEMRYFSDSMPAQYLVPQSRCTRTSVAGMDSFEAIWRSQQRHAKTGCKDIIELIDDIELDVTKISVKDKVRVIEMVGGVITWNDIKDPVKGCTVTLNHVDRIFHNMNNLDAWIKSIAIPRIHDYLET